MITKCRVCEISAKEYMKIGEHYIKEKDFTCILCQGTQSIYHQANEDTAGYSYECNNCHNYIWYSMNDDSPYKEELYFEEWCLIQDYEDNTSTIINDNDKDTIRLSQLINIENKQTLFERLKTYIIIS